MEEEKKECLPQRIDISMEKIQNTRYGENKNQKGGFYRNLSFASNEPCIVNAKQLQGKELSFNNILDANSAIECAKEFDDLTCVIIKHNTPCGIASARNLSQAWDDAYATDTYSPFGGVVVFNRILDKEVAEKISHLFLEVVIAPDFFEETTEILKKKNGLRVLKVEGLDQKFERKGLDIRSVVGGFLVQDRDVWFTDKNNWKVATEKQPSPEDLISMEFAIKCVKHIKSNSVVFVKGKRTVGIGGGQTSRVDATWIATSKGKENIKDSIMASDAFFPFRDGVDVAVKAGVKAIIQPGGSKRDEEVIKAANENGIAMVFTGQRYFRH